MVLVGGNQPIEVISDPQNPFNVLQDSSTSIGNQNVVDSDFAQIVTLVFIGTLAGFAFEPLVIQGTATDYQVPALTDSRIALIYHVIPNNATRAISFGYADDITGTNFVTLIPKEIFSPRGDDLLIYDILSVVPAGKFIGHLNNIAQPRGSDILCEIREVPIWKGKV